MISIHPPNPALRATVSQALPDLPSALTDMVMDYTAKKNYSLVREARIRFDRQGRVLNPEVRAAYKEVFMSSYCEPEVKSRLMYKIFHPLFVDDDTLLIDEVRTIFDEIAAADYRVMFDHVTLAHLLIQFVNWTGISLVGANLSGAQLANVKMPYADLTNMMVNNGEWTDVEAHHANLSGTHLNRLYVAQNVDLTDAVGLESRPQQFVSCPINEPAEDAATVIATSLNNMPGYVLEVIAGYLARTDYSALSRYRICFDESDRVTNHAVRQAYKEAFISSYCNGNLKSMLICNLFEPSYQTLTKYRELLAEEGRKIFNEIVTEGHRACLDKLTLRDINLTFINWAGASMVRCFFFDVTLINIDMRKADARDMYAYQCEWNNVNVDQAIFTGATLHNVRVVPVDGLTNAIGVPRID